MREKSHIDLEKLSKVPSGKPFEYKDVVSDNLFLQEHTEDGKRFKEEVLEGIYNNVKIEFSTLYYNKKFKTRE